MNDKFAKTFVDQRARMLEPSHALAKLTMAKLEQLVSLQMASLSDYADLNFNQIKAVTGISGPEDMKTYVEKQQEYLKTVAEKMAGDAQAATAISKEFAEEAREILTTGFAAEPGGPAAPAPTRPAAVTGPADETKPKK